MHDQIPRHSLVTNLTHELRQMILDGQIQPGEYLPSQKDLAARFGVGLSTIHEAVQVLVAGGLLQARPGKGTWVNPEFTPVTVRLRLLFPCRDWPAPQRHTTIAAPATGVR
mgnify:CR=1 FL=1